MTLDALLVPVLAFAASWGGIKVSLNGTKARVERMEEKLDDVGDRVARIEGALGVTK